MVSIDLSTQFNIPGTYELFALSDEDTKTVYAYNKAFWLERHSLLDQAGIDRILKVYRARSIDPDRMVPASNIAKLAAPVTDAGGTFSILELGCANGPLLRSLDAINALDGIYHVGVEPYEPFASDYRELYPERRMIHAEAEDFVEMSAIDFPEAPFSIFLSSVTLCLIEPKTAKACLAKAAELCDEIIFYEYVLNGLGPINRQETIVYQFNKTLSQYYFAHNYPAYLADVGFEIVSGIPIAHPNGMEGVGTVEGYALIRAVRKQ